MGIKSRAVQRRIETVGVPPDTIESNELIVSILKARGNSLYEVLVPPSEATKLQKALSSPDHEYTVDSEESRTILVAMPPKFRNTIFVKRGSNVVVELYGPEVLHGDTESKVKGEFSNIVTNKKEWQRYPYWPVEFKEVPKDDWGISSSEEEDDGAYSTEEETAEGTEN
ncbi:hypothetical protein AWJ20_2876 [Sugiyamaella lignohabitans]|uniref:S1-like domain-containing protein n=1 Tax=Sugiyamaella lignohabitans TaxID=796027 RepID=A0A161HH61_9ASCO|nr:uncharacterized protein AWJ20_2876 [Sugiyamaella lignohabitans]ANB15250.1 hypothetical protein AWJ20_2876 [Sugiyamaella lignohabitans]